MNKGSFLRLHTLVSFEIGRFDRVLAKLKAAHFPSLVPLQFIDLLREELRFQEASLSAIVADFELDPEGAISRLKSEHRKLVDKLSFLEAIENSRTDEVPWSLIPSIERLASVLIPDRRILTSATALINYQIAWYRGPSQGAAQFFVLSLPKVHRANAFLHLLVGHELFHPLLDEFLKTEKESVLPRLRDGCKEFLKTIDEEPDSLFSAEKNPQRLDTLVLLTEMAWERGMEELMCDLGCVAVFGPAAVFSASMFASAFSLDEQPSPEGDFYPPWRYRLRTMLAYAIDSKEGKEFVGALRRALQSSEFDEDIQTFDAALLAERELTSHENDLKTIRENQLLKLAYDEIQGSLSRAWQYLSTKVNGVDDRWTESIDEVPSLLRTLQRDVPPGECRSPKARIGKPASLSSIALACWIYQLRIESTGDAKNSAFAFRRTCRLMLKAFEDSELKRYFNGSLRQE